VKDPTVVILFLPLAAPAGDDPDRVPVTDPRMLLDGHRMVYVLWRRRLSRNLLSPATERAGESKHEPALLRGIRSG